MSRKKLTLLVILGLAGLVCALAILFVIGLQSGLIQSTDHSVEVELVSPAVS